MKTCGSTKCFFAVSARQIIKEGFGEKLIATLKEKGVCDETSCEKWTPEIPEED
jgi:hypothetical protein